MRRSTRLFSLNVKVMKVSQMPVMTEQTCIPMSAFMQYAA